MNYAFPESWDQRATSVVYDFAAELQDMSPDEIAKELAGRFASDYKLWDSRTSYLSDLLIAVSLVLSGDFPDQGNFRRALEEYPQFGAMPKMAAFAAFEIARHEDIRRAGFARGGLNALHKGISGLLFEAVIEPFCGRSLTLTNKASQLQLNASRDLLCVYFKMDGQLDGSAATLASVGASVLMNREPEFGVNDFQYAAFVSDRHCSAFSTQRIDGDVNQFELVTRLANFYGPFRSVGPLHIDFECETDGVWLLILSAIQHVARDLQLKIKVSH